MSGTGFRFLYALADGSEGSQNWFDQHAAQARRTPEFLLPSGCPHGIRKVPKFYPNEINDLDLENVGFQNLSLRHLTQRNVSPHPTSVGIFRYFQGFCGMGY